MNITIKNLTKKIKKETVLKDINLEFHGGKIYGLQGKNGCGKTMLMRCIAGLVHPEQGESIINGKVLHKDMSLPESIGLLIENPAFLPQYTGLQNLKILADLQGGISYGELEELLEKVGLKDCTKKKFGAYSLGMKQRLGIALALLANPKLLILDEPTNGLDPIGIEELRELIKTFPEQGMTVILSSHILSEVQMCADYIGIISDGVLGYEGKLLPGQNLEELFMDVVKKNRKLQNIE